MEINQVHIDIYGNAKINQSIDPSYSDPSCVSSLPDYNEPVDCFVIQEAYFAESDKGLSFKSREYAFNSGALAVLKILGDEFLSQSELVNLARKLTHEVRHFMVEYEKNHPSW